MKEFEVGALMALATLNAQFDQPSMCASTINELGLTGIDCSELSDFDKQSLRKINENLPTCDRLTGLGG